MTADDGWDDGFNYLFPLAKKYKIPFVLAIIYNKVSRLPSEINNFLNE
jgi:peptidoglycan/xylan/chitin deacetylase (PgdA/CDA1 family)